MTSRIYRISDDQALACFQSSNSRRVQVRVFEISEKEEFLDLFNQELKFLKIMLGSKYVKEIENQTPKKSVFPITIKKYKGSVQIEHQLGSDKLRYKAAGDIRVLIVDDSRTMRTILSKSIEAMNGFTVSATAESSEKAREIIEQDRPDVITLDLHMPGENGADFLKNYLGKMNIPTILITSVTMEEGPLVMDALSNGAMTYIQKPELKQMSDTQEELLTALSQASNYNVEIINQETSRKTAKFVEKRGSMIVIGSSTGGVGALEKILTSFPDNIPPILIVQHIPASFSKAFAERLDSLCPFRVKEAEDGEKIERNCVYIAPGGYHMTIQKTAGESYVQISDGPSRNNFKPSVDVLFDSIAQESCRALTAVILTGMGFDGSKGLLRLKEMGAYTIAQDKETSAVFGMPKEAIAIGAVQEVAPLGQIANSISKRFSS